MTEQDNQFLQNYERMKPQFVKLHPFMEIVSGQDMLRFSHMPENERTHAMLEIKRSFVQP